MPGRISLCVPSPDKCMGHPSGRPQEFSWAAAARPLKGHGDVPGFLPSDSVPLHAPRLVVFSDFGIGSPCGETLAKFRVRLSDITSAEANPVL